ncbi:MAG TPA: DUF4147 domain-containing protein [Gemmatimonadaceae bacterium]|nr:DUF4147 domain-containing protein [Gemmatimonadaceae bacterium]
MTTCDEASLARALHHAAVTGADAAAATRRALADTPFADSPRAATPADAAAPRADTRLWIVAAGKAARPMARAALVHLREHGRTVAGGLVVAPADAAADTPVHGPPERVLRELPGDHPVPGPRSAAAAHALGEFLPRIAAGDVLLVLLSGGATALLGAPVPGLAEDEYLRLVERLLGSGADIGVMNALRKRVSRWGAGRLAAAVPCVVHCLAISDVAGDDLATIGSGPCVPDALTSAMLRDLLAREALAPLLPPGVARYLEDVARGERPETPKPGDACFARVRARVILSNRDAVAAAAAAAERAGADVACEPAELRGAAAEAGRACAHRLLALAAARGDAPRPLCVLWGGETTVALGAESAGRGGRCQELALAAAAVLHEAGARGVTLLAGGTDGIDGPTDAAGAVVDGGTWVRIARAGIDPAAALARHDAYPALAAAGALLRTGPTGTNVRDVVIGVVGR